MDIDLDAGIKYCGERVGQECHPTRIAIFATMKEVLIAMRTKISHICDKCANECKATHLREECSLYTPKPFQGQDPCEETFETKQSDLNKIYGICVHPACRHKDAEIQRLKDRLAEADDLLNNPNTITIDRKVAQKFINAISQKQCSPLEIEVYKEFKRALGEKEDICIHNK